MHNRLWNAQRNNHLRLGVCQVPLFVSPHCFGFSVSIGDACTAYRLLGKYKLQVNRTSGSKQFKLWFAPMLEFILILTCDMLIWSFYLYIFLFFLKIVCTNFFHCEVIGRFDSYLCAINTSYYALLVLFWPLTRKNYQPKVLCFIVLGWNKLKDFCMQNLYHPHDLKGYLGGMMNGWIRGVVSECVYVDPALNTIHLRLQAW